MRGLACVLLLVVAALITGCGDDGEQPDPAQERLEAADRVLARSPRDPRAMDGVVRAAFAGYNDHLDPESGAPDEDARDFLLRAGQVWPRYVAATRDRPRAPVAAIMVQVYGNGLNRPRDAARAAQFVTEAQPTSASYLQLMLWATRAGDTRTAQLAGQKALELASPEERAQVREAIRTLAPTG